MQVICQIGFLLEKAQLFHAPAAAPQPHSPHKSTSKRVQMVAQVIFFVFLVVGVLVMAIYIGTQPIAPNHNALATPLLQGASMYVLACVVLCNVACY